jgi:hypothetical protein
MMDPLIYGMSGHAAVWLDSLPNRDMCLTQTAQVPHIHGQVTKHHEQAGKISEGGSILSVQHSWKHHTFKRHTGKVSCCVMGSGKSISLL